MTGRKPSFDANVANGNRAMKMVATDLRTAVSCRDTRSADRRMRSDVCGLTHRGQHENRCRTRRALVVTVRERSEMRLILIPSPARAFLSSYPGP